MAFALYIFDKPPMYCISKIYDLTCLDFKSTLMYLKINKLLVALEDSTKKLPEPEGDDKHCIYCETIFVIKFYLKTCLNMLSKKILSYNLFHQYREIYNLSLPRLKRPTQPPFPVPDFRKRNFVDVAGLQISGYLSCDSKIFSFCILLIYF